MSDPIVLVVRRGAERRFEALKNRTSQLNVEIVWDRRERPRRAQAAAAVPDRRRAERRRNASDTWEIADFCVAVPPRSEK